jgi:TPR repeat protein
VDLAEALIEDEGGPEDKQRGADILTEQCAADFFRGCVIFGTSVRKGELADPDKRAAAYLEKACDRDFLVACLELGTDQLAGNVGLPREPEKALATYQKACDHKSGVGCFFVGDTIMNGVVGTPDAKRARTAFAQGCALKDDESCARLNTMPQ